VAGQPIEQVLDQAARDAGRHRIQLLHIFDLS
jgi:hypothetical protein